jgi:UDP-N-acetylmuramyl tripeptide synthase
VKEQIVAELERTGVEAVPSKSYHTRCLARLLGSDFVVRVAQPLEEDRFNVKIEDIVQHFANLEELEMSHISFHIINLDGTGFGASKSGRQKSRKIIVPQSLSKKPVFKETSHSHFITALCAISASGNVLRSGLIAKRQTDHPDADQCSFLRNVQRYVNPNAFVTSQSLNDYLRNVLSPYIAH